MGYGLWVMDYGLWVMDYGLWVMDYRLLAMGYVYLSLSVYLFHINCTEQVNSGDMKNLLERLVRVSYMGLDFLNTFLTTFPLFTTSTVVMEFLVKVSLVFVSFTVNDHFCLPN